jgi:osmoprotectant transport system permease protein
MRRAEAERMGIDSLDDLAPASPRLSFATDVEFLERPEWAAVRRTYPIRFKSATPYNPSFMYRAIESGKADVISAFSSDGRIAAQDLKVLADPRQAIPGYDAILMLAPGRAEDAALVAAVRPLIGAIPVQAMREANWMVDRDADKRSPDAAAAWLDEQLTRTGSPAAP